MNKVWVLTSTGENDEGMEVLGVFTDIKEIETALKSDQFMKGYHLEVNYISDDKVDFEFYESEAKFEANGNTEVLYTAREVPFNELNPAALRY